MPLLGMALTAAMLLTAGSAQAQLLYSFEGGLDGFLPWGSVAGQTNPGYLNHAQTATGATLDTFALEVETLSGFSRDVFVEEFPGSAAYDVFNAVAAAPENFTFDFDVTFTQESWDRVDDPGGFFQINVFSNSDTLQFKEVFGAGNGSPGSPSTAQVSFPATEISLIPDSSFFELGFGSNSNHTQGPMNEGVRYYIDNVRFSPVLDFVEETLFSWETPDDLGTIGLNEQLEGWRDGFDGEGYFHTRAITGNGATDGGSALSINSEVPNPGSSIGNFAWGSQITIDSSVEEGDPANQPQITNLIRKVNRADKIAFDVTFPEDQFGVSGGLPTFLSLFVNISDGSGTFYQSPAKQAGNPVEQEGDTITIEVPLSELSASGMNLGSTDLDELSSFFRIALATNSDDFNTFYIDNLRLLTELSGVAGDYNNDGVVDAADYTVYRDNLGQSVALNNENPAAATPGVVDLEDYTFWTNNYGSGAPSEATAVPEPAGAALLLLGLVAGAAARRIR